MRDRLPRRAALLAIACLAFAGCGALPKLEAPKLSVVSMKMQSADIFSQRLQVRMRVLNPNARELPIKGIEYRIEVNDAQLAQGLTDTPFVVPAMGEAEFDVQVTANLAGALAKFLARRGGSQDTLDYRLIGSVALSSGLLRRIPFDERGSVKLK
ncbi:MAG: LEA type 2 family protein [Pseudomonadota bacterium]